MSHLQKGLKWLFYFGFLWIRSVQIGSNLIKLEFSSILIQKVVTSIMRIRMVISFLIRLDQNCPKFIKLDQFSPQSKNVFKFIMSSSFDQSKNVAVKSCHIYQDKKNDHYIFDQIGSELSKMDQTWSNWNLKMLL